jgi:hypothetical protein
MRIELSCLGSRRTSLARELSELALESDSPPSMVLPSHYIECTDGAAYVDTTQ